MKVMLAILAILVLMGATASAAEPIANPFVWEIAPQWTAELTMVGGQVYVVFMWEGP